MKKRLPAEWEPQECIWLSWPHNLDNWGKQLENIREFYLDLIEIIVQYQKVHLVIQPEDLLALIHLCETKNLFSNHRELKNFFNDQAPEKLKENQVAFTLITAKYSVKLFFMQSNTIWIRDYGPFFLSDGSMAEFEFNSWGSKFPPYHLDNSIPEQISKYPIYPQRSAKPLKTLAQVFEGGSLEVNGKGIGLSTHDCIYNLNRNTAEESEKLILNLKDTFGINQLLILPHGLVGDHTDGHIDNVARFINDKTLLLLCPQDQEDPNYVRMQSNKEFLIKNLPDSIRIVDIPSLPPRVIKTDDESHRLEHLPLSYANFIFLNGAIILPDYGDERSLNLAKETLSKELTGYQLETINCNLLIQEGGSLHCMTKNQYTFISDYVLG